jgi:hypothetical protein
MTSSLPLSQYVRRFDFRDVALMSCNLCNPPSPPHPLFRFCVLQCAAQLFS